MNSPTSPGHSQLPPGSLAGPDEHLLPSPPPSAPDEQALCQILQQQLDLTPRQAEILYWVTEGKSNHEVAIILGCSINTVKTHLKAIFRHLTLQSRAAAVACACRTLHQHSRPPAQHHPYG